MFIALAWRGVSAEVALFSYAHALSAEKRRNPTDDVWSILATGELEESLLLSLDPRMDVVA